jgi:hypothetical protein
VAVLQVLEHAAAQHAKNMYHERIVRGNRKLEHQHALQVKAPAAYCVKAGIHPVILS